MVCWSCNEFSSDTCELCEYRYDRPSHEEVSKTQVSKERFDWPCRGLLSSQMKGTNFRLGGGGLYRTPLSNKRLRGRKEKKEATPHPPKKNQKAFLRE